MYLNDEPISNLSEDKLNRGKFVSQIARNISEWKSSESLIIAIYGQWGTGKSSVLNLLEQVLDEHQSQKDNKSEFQMQIVRFDPWYFNSTEHLLRSFFKSIEKATRTFFDDKASLLDTFNKYSAKMSFISLIPEISIGPLKVKFPTSFKKGEDKSPEKIRMDLVKQLMNIKGRILVMVDNLDRLDAAELLLVFKLVRLCSDFPNFTYILAFDRNQVTSNLFEQSKINSEFLEKIVQVDVNLPAINQSQIDIFIDEGIKHIVKINSIQPESNIWNRFGMVYQQYISEKLISNFRTAKRYLNAIAFSMPLIKGEVNIADFLAVECIRVFYPSLYEEIPKYKNELAAFDIPSTEGEDVSRKLRHKNYADIQKWIEKVYADENPFSAEGILEFLFPLFGAYLSNPQNPVNYPIYYAEQFERDQNISSPSHFFRYFTLTLPSTDISTNVINHFIELLNQSKLEASVDSLGLILREYKQNGSLVEFLRKLLIYLEVLNSNGKVLLVNLLSESSDEYSWKRNILVRGEMGLASTLVIRCLNFNEDHLIVEDLLSNIIRTTPSLPFASQIVNKICSSEYKKYIPEELNLDKVKAPLKERFQIELIDENEDIFISNPDSFSLILSSWSNPEVLNDIESSNNYVYRMLNNNTHAVGQLLADFVWTEVDTREPTELEFARIDRIYDIDMIYEIINHQDEDAQRTEIEIFAISEFVRIYENLKEEK